MIFISAGHNSQSTKVPQDPGAVYNGIKEGDLTIEFRNLIAIELTKKNVPFKVDSDEETLQQYLNRIQTGTGSVVYECHFDAGPVTANGTTCLVQIDADRLDKACAKEIADITSLTFEIPNRGVRSEVTTRHKRLALMRENGIVVLHELAFITNSSDLSKYHAKKYDLAKKIANILIKYEQIIP